MSCYPSAEIFLSRIHRTECGCLILDQLLPGLNGLKLLEILRGRGMLVPTVFLTGDSDPALPRKAKEAGARAILHKPAANDVLLTEIRQVLASSGPT